MNFDFLEKTKQMNRRCVKVKNGYKLADLSNEQNKQINDLEEQLDIVLVAWEKGNQVGSQDYYKAYEDDRL